MDNWWYRCIHLLPEDASFLKGDNSDHKVNYLPVHYRSYRHYESQRRYNQGILSW